MKNLLDIITEYLDSIGADGLMKPDWEDRPIAITPDDIMRDKDAHLHLQLVPAYRHADGSYHAEKEIGDEPCLKCPDADGDWCKRLVACDAYKHWLAHKEAAK